MEIVPGSGLSQLLSPGKDQSRRPSHTIGSAYSVSRELIEIGVRCVIAAGWAVDDDAAYTFAEAFYRCILQDKLQFGDAVFEARRETYRKHGSSITWGAYQAYGDPGWRMDPRRRVQQPWRGRRADLSRRKN